MGVFVQIVYVIEIKLETENSTLEMKSFQDIRPHIWRRGS